MLFLEQPADQGRLLLATVQMAANPGHQLGAIGRSALSEGVGLDVLVEQLVGIELRAVPGQMDQAKPFPVVGDEAPGAGRAVHRMAVDDQIDPPRGLPQEPFHEVDEAAAVEPSPEHHEG